MEFIYADAIFSFYALLLQVVHYILAFQLLLDQLACSVCNLIRPKADDSKFMSLNRLQQDSKSLNLPSHVGIAFGHSEISHEEIATLLVWCIGMGISVITLFDEKGLIRRNQAFIHKLLKQKCQELLGVSMSRLGVYLYQPHKEKGENGIHCRTRVRLLDGSNGKHDIVEAVRNVCIDVQHCKFKADSIDARKLEEYLNATEGLPDPGLLLAIGPVYSTSNYPPWQIRLTEIIYLKATHKLRYSDFLNSLRSFSKCEQRFGK